MSRSASDLLDPVQYESSDQSQEYFASAINPVTANTATIRPAFSTTNLYSCSTNGNINISSASHCSRNNSCTSDEESIANTVYSIGQLSTTNTSVNSSNHHKASDNEHQQHRYHCNHHCDSRSSNCSSSSNTSSGCVSGSCTGSHKIALVTNKVPHVSNIVVSASKPHLNVEDAMSRLDQLSGSVPGGLPQGMSKVCFA